MGNYDYFLWSPCHKYIPMSPHPTVKSPKPLKVASEDAHVGRSRSLENEYLPHVCIYTSYSLQLLSKTSISTVKTKKNVKKLLQKTTFPISRPDPSSTSAVTVFKSPTTHPRLLFTNEGPLTANPSVIGRTHIAAIKKILKTIIKKYGHFPTSHMPSAFALILVN